MKVFSYEGATFEHAIREHVPPDPRAGEFWLRNRRPDRWKDKQHINHDVDPESPLAALARELAGTALRPKED